MKEWWTFVHSGIWEEIDLGPYPSQEEALESLNPLREKAQFGTLAACHSLRLAGPFPTKKQALEADISTCQNVEIVS